MTYYSEASEDDYAFGYSQAPIRRLDSQIMRDFEENR